MVKEQAVTVLSDPAKRAFRRDGFIAIDQLVGEAEVQRLHAILMRLHINNVGFDEGAQYDASGADGDVNNRRFPQFVGPHAFARELLNGTYYQKALELAREILGPTAKFKGDISFLKPARIGSITPWHQDGAFGNPDFDCDEISIWLALTEASPANSCMSFIPKSHQLEIMKHRPMDGDPRNHALECIGDFDPADAIECPLAPGGCTIHTERTLHCAGANPSSNARLAYVLEFDTPPVLRAKPNNFPWQIQQNNTDHVRRTRAWIKRGGFLIILWRKRRNIRFNQLRSRMRRLL